jgi:hypothetical protein
MRVGEYLFEEKKFEEKGSSRTKNGSSETMNDRERKRQQLT